MQLPTQRQQAVGPQSAIAVAEHRQERDDLVERSGHVQHQVVVAQRLVFDEVDLRQGLNSAGIDVPPWGFRKIADTDAEPVALPGPAFDPLPGLLL